MRVRNVRIDALAQSALRYHEHTVVYIDVISACTTLVTAVAQGRRTLPASSLAEVARLMKVVPGALAAGVGESADTSHLTLNEQLTHSPAALGRRSDRRALVLLDLPGTELIGSCDGNRDVYLACLRNLSATIEYLAAHAERDVVLIAAAEGDDFRCEDKLAAARIGRALLSRGFQPVGPNTVDVIERWGEADTKLIAWGRSAQRLRRQGRAEDLEFVLKHVDDLDLVCGYRDGEIVDVRRQWPVLVAHENAAV
jgi:phosphosulfolactate phosphohydrolase-like enzyme